MHAGRAPPSVCSPQTQPRRPAPSQVQRVIEEVERDRADAAAARARLAQAEAEAAEASARAARAEEAAAAAAAAAHAAGGSPQPPSSPSFMERDLLRRAQKRIAQLEGELKQAAAAGGGGNGQGSGHGPADTAHLRERLQALEEKLSEALARLFPT